RGSGRSERLNQRLAHHPLHLFHRRHPRPHQFLHRSHRPPHQPARHDQLEVPQVRRHIQRNAMQRHSPPNPHAHPAHLRLLPPPPPPLLAPISQWPPDPSVP